MDHFKNFNGFGAHGAYLSHSTKEPCDVARDVLTSLAGQKVQVSYEDSSRKEFEPDSKNYFTPHSDIFQVKKQHENGYLRDANTDNILIETGGLAYEIQRIVIGSQWITELRMHQ